MDRSEIVREFLQSAAGRVTAGGVVVVACVALFLAVRGSLGGSDAAALAADRTYIDAATGKPFEHTLKRGETLPVKAPSGDKTGYPAELCYWTDDGRVKDKPTAVLLNTYKGSPEPTFCPDCGRLVVLHNPAPMAGATPPPTRAAYAVSRAARAGKKGAAAPDEGDGR